MRGRSSAATWGSGNASPRVSAVPSWSWAAGPAVSRCRWPGRPTCSSGSIGPPRCSRGPDAGCVARATGRGSGSFGVTFGRCRFRSPAVSARDRAVRHPAVAAARPRSHRHAPIGQRGAGDRWHIWHRSRTRSCGLGRVREPGQPEGPPQPEGLAFDADRIGASGSGATPEDLRSTLRRASRCDARRTPVLADLPDDVRAADDPPPRSRRLRGRRGPG